MKFKLVSHGSTYTADAAWRAHSQIGVGIMTISERNYFMEGALSWLKTDLQFAKEKFE